MFHLKEIAPAKLFLSLRWQSYFWHNDSLIMKPANFPGKTVSETEAYFVLKQNAYFALMHHFVSSHVFLSVGNGY